MRKLLSFIFVLSILFGQNDFSAGPYGSDYFDVAGPFGLIDLNLDLGDVKADNSVNILDIIETVTFVLGNIDFTSYQSSQVDLNFDSEVNILDIVALANIILNK